MRKTPPSDADRGDWPAPDEPGRVPSDAAASGADSTAPVSAGDDTPSDENTAPSLVWPPVDDELNDWEVLHLRSTGHTIIEPMKLTAAPYVPPAPIDDPAGDTSLLPISSDYDLPETELIEPLSEHAQTLPTMPAISGPHAATPAPASPDDRTVVIPRPAAFALKSEPPLVVASQEDTNPGVGTRIIVAPAFAASVGHAPTVPVSALHRAARPPRSEPAFGPRLPMEDTLPAGVTRELLAGGASAEWTADRSDDTVVHAAQADTHPVPVAVPRRAPAGPAGPPTPFSRVPSRGPQPVVTDASSLPSPAPVHSAPPPLAFGPRVPSGPPAASAGAAVPPLAAVAPAPAFPAHDAQIPARPAPTSTRTKLVSMALAVAAVLLVALGVFQFVSMRSTSAGALAAATLSVESTPAGATVTIDGTPRGKTPMRLELTEGRHAMDVSLNGASRQIPLVLAAGTVTAHSLEFATPVAPTVSDSAIEIRSDPPGGRVLVDGVARGTTPIVVTGLAAGRHQVQVSGPFRAVTRTVTLAASQQALLVVTPARTSTAAPAPNDERPTRAAAGTGYITIQSPIVLRVVRNGDFVGTSEDSRLSLPVGNQVIGLENESVGFRDVRTVEVIGGKVTPVAVTLPKGEISINARPWAEVFVDGNRVGETPVSQMSLPVGIHEVLFRHPEHGERTVSVVVKIGATGRAFTDFTK